MMETLRARHVVVGAGAMGTATAYHLARRGEPVLLVEQFRVGHDRGSSHGAARITRHSYADARYARLMLDAFRCWRQLEADAGQSLYIRTGGVSFAPAESSYVSDVAASLAAIDVPHRRMTGKELNRVLPAFRVPETYDVVFEPDAGMLAASRAVALQVELARQFGGEATQVREGCAIRHLDLQGEKPVLSAEGLRIVADRLIIAAGAWAPQLLAGLGVTLRPTRQQVLYFRPIEPAPFQVGRFPVFISKGLAELDDYYGMPAFLSTGVKIARHGGHDVEPDAVDRTIGDDYRELVRRFLRGHIPSLADAAIDHTEVCLYTVADDDQFRVGFWPGRTDAIVASPCSGHGFKFSNLIGRVLADLAVEGQTRFDIEAWALAGGAEGE